MIDVELQHEHLHHLLSIGFTTHIGETHLVIKKSEQFSQSNITRYITSLTLTLNVWGPLNKLICDALCHFVTTRIAKRAKVMFSQASVICQMHHGIGHMVTGGGEDEVDIISLPPPLDRTTTPPLLDRTPRPPWTGHPLPLGRRGH